MSDVSAPLQTESASTRLVRRARGPKRVLPEALKSHLWQPGQSGNPKGASGKYIDAMRLARQHSVEAVTRLVELMSDEDGRVAAVACQSIWDKAWGKREPPPDDGAPEQQLDLSQLSPAELRFLLKLVRSGAVRMIEPPSEEHAADQPSDGTIEGASAVEQTGSLVSG